MSQAQRDRAMRGFRDRRFEVLVATDIVARGIDVNGVSHVINYDVPNTPEAYTHRIGRTGRSEREGTACTFVTREDWDWVRATERMIGAPIERRQVERLTEAEVAAQAQRTHTPDPRGRSEGSARGRRGRGAKPGSASRRTGRRRYR
jgi:ATP-dependent RNA helicase RhlE